MRVLVTGPQGSGKSTQAVLLAQDLGVSYIQLGEIFRTVALVDDSEIAKKVRQALTAGELVAPDLAAKIINKRLAQADCKNGFVLDGFPRNLKDITNFSQKLDIAFYLKISDQVAVKRLLARSRADDTQELIEERLKNYHQETAPILEVFKKSGILVEIDGERPIDVIHDDIVKYLKAREIH